MDWYLSALSAGTGAIAIAVIDQFVSRFFNAPRIQTAVKSVSLARTKHRWHNSIPVSESLRELLADGSTKYIGWDDAFISEHAVDLSILELTEGEQRSIVERADLKQRLAVLTDRNVRAEVLSLARNLSLLSTCRNALIQFPDKTPQVPAQGSRKPVVFPVVRREREEDGEKRVLIHLALPGNPFPIVGARNGRADLNEKAEPLIYAMSCCDDAILRSVLSLAVEECDYHIGHCRRLRDALEKIKKERLFLELALIVTNKGASTAYLSCFAEARLGNAKKPVAMTRVDDTVQDDEKPNYPSVIRDDARRLTDWLPELKQQLQAYDTGVENIPVPAGETIQIHFVSDDTVPQPIADAITALLTGYAHSAVSVWQYLPRRFLLLPRVARFRRKLTTLQSLTATRPQ